MYKVKLTKIISDHSIVRTNEIEGTTSELPQVGSRFKMSAKSLTEGMDFRYVETSEIQSVEMVDEKYVIKTMNSVYELEIIATMDVKEFI